MFSSVATDFGPNTREFAYDLSNFIRHMMPVITKYGGLIIPIKRLLEIF